VTLETSRRLVYFRQSARLLDIDVVVRRRRCACFFLYICVPNEVVHRLYFNIIVECGANFYRKQKHMLL
jgi:hypothetical protein